jgi:hypothetical protein
MGDNDHRYHCKACGKDRDDHTVVIDSGGRAVAGSWQDGWTLFVCASGYTIKYPRPTPREKVNDGQNST